MRQERADQRAGKRPGRETGPSELGYGLAVLLLVTAAAALIFRSYLGSGSDLFFSVIRDTNPMEGWYPWSRFNLASFGQGFFPLWNPYNLLGEPHLAHYQSAVFSILFLPLWVSFDLTALPYLLLRLGAAGLGAYLFGRRLGLSRAGSTTAAVAFGLSGYLVQYVNNLHLVIDLLIPYLLLAAHGLIHRRRLPDLLALTIVTTLVLLGGQPSAALAALALGYGYALTTGLTRPRRAGALVLTAAAGCLAALISQPQLLPFLELIPQGWTFHYPGFGAISMPGPGLVTAIAPGFLGPLDRAREILPLALIAPYLGASVVCLALVAMMRPRTPDRAFLAATILIGVGLIAGAPPFNLLAELPGLGRFSFLKYLQPIVTFAAAVLAGYGVDEVRSGRARWRALAAGAVVTGAATGAALAFGDLTTASYGWGSVGFASVMALAPAVVAIGVKPGRTSLAGPALAALVLIELVFAASGNRPLQERNLAREDFNPVREICASPALGRCSFADDVEVPNMVLAAPVFDIGFAEAIMLRPSVDLFTEAAGYDSRSLHRHFMKYHALTLPYPAPGNRVAELMGVRHQLSRRTLPQNRTIDAVITHGRLLAPDPRHSYKTRVEIGRDLRDALFAHPPCRWDVPLKQLETAHRGANQVTGVVGLSPAITEREGDGVGFALLQGGPAPALRWARYVDPRRQRTERSWIDFDLSSDAPSFTLITLPNDSVDNDWAAWGDLRVGRDRADRAARMVSGIRDYPLAGRPRAFLADEDAGQGRVEVESYDLQRVRIAVTAESPTDLILADAYYPGWRVWVNGREKRINRADLALRSVTVPAGESELFFRYEPRSFAVALWAGLSALVMALAAGLIPSILRPTEAKAPK